MARHPRTLLTCLAFAALFTVLFHGTGIGLNLLLFELAAFGFLITSHRVRMERNVLLTLGATLLTALLVVWYGSKLALVMNLVSALLAIGTVLAPEFTALHHSALLAVAPHCRTTGAVAFAPLAQERFACPGHHTARSPVRRARARDRAALRRPLQRLEPLLR
jgi:hypothetical protein